MCQGNELGPRVLCQLWPLSSPCGAWFAQRVLSVPTGVQSYGRGLVLGSQCISWPQGCNSCSPPTGVECPGEQQGQGAHGAAWCRGALGVPPLHLCGLVMPSMAPVRWAASWASTAEQRRGVWAACWGPTGDVPPGFPLGAGPGAWQPGRAAALAAGSGSAPPAHCRFLLGG